MRKSTTRIYIVWNSMRRRCYAPTDVAYKHYGGRGITVCEEWLNSFENFEKWAGDTGYDPSAPKGVCTLDRINRDGNYEPSNCHWATNIEQQNNKRRNRRITYNGVTKTATQWGIVYGIKQGTIYSRLNRGITDPKYIFARSLHRHDIQLLE